MYITDVLLLSLQVCLVGKSRNYQEHDEAEAELRRTRFVDSRRVGGQGSGVDVAMETGFRPRDKVETVRNCAALPRDFIDGVVLLVARALLGLNRDDDNINSDDWNPGGKKKTQANQTGLQRGCHYL